MSDEESWKTSFDANGNRNVYNDDDERIATEYSRLHDTRLQKPEQSAAPRRTGQGDDGTSFIAGILVAVLSFVLRYAPFVLLAYYLAHDVIPRFAPSELNQYVVWGAGATGGLLAALAARALFRVVFQAGDSPWLVPLKAVTAMAICGLQFAAAAWFTMGFFCPGEYVPTSLDQVSLRFVIGAVVGLGLGFVIARWVFHRWIHSVMV
jgi:hypothetical protein